MMKLTSVRPSVPTNPHLAAVRFGSVGLLNRGGGKGGDKSGGAPPATPPAAGSATKAGADALPPVPVTPSPASTTASTPASKGGEDGWKSAKPAGGKASGGKAAAAAAAATAATAEASVRMWWDEALFERSHSMSFVCGSVS